MSGITAGRLAGLSETEIARNVLRIDEWTEAEFIEALRTAELPDRRKVLTTEFSQDDLAAAAASAYGMSREQFDREYGAQKAE